MCGCTIPGHSTEFTPLLYAERRHHVVWQEDLAQSRKTREPVQDSVRTVELQFEEMRDPAVRCPHRESLDDRKGVFGQRSIELVRQLKFEREDVERVWQCFHFRSDLAADLREEKEGGEVAQWDCRGEREAEMAVWVLCGRSKGAELGGKTEKRGVLRLGYGFGELRVVLLWWRGNGVSDKPGMTHNI
jgi:hypothetical protein